MRPAFKQDPLFRKGLRIRKEVPGPDTVANRLKSATRYTRGFEELTTKAAWGLIWSRSGLSRRIRNFINLGVLTALGQPHELRLHVRAALRNGVTRDEIAEAILHCAVYCGIPRAADARRIMCEVFRNLRDRPPFPAREIGKRGLSLVFYAPAATPKEIIARLNAEIVKSIQRPDVAGRLAAEGAEPTVSTPEQFRAFIKHEIQSRPISGRTTLSSCICRISRPGNGVFRP